MRSHAVTLLFLLISTLLFLVPAGAVDTAENNNGNEMPDDNNLHIRDDATTSPTVNATTFSPSSMSTAQPITSLDTTIDPPPSLTLSPSSLVATSTGTANGPGIIVTGVPDADEFQWVEDMVVGIWSEFGDFPGLTEDQKQELRELGMDLAGSSPAGMKQGVEEWVREEREDASGAGRVEVMSGALAVMVLAALVVL